VGNLWISLSLRNYVTNQHESVFIHRDSEFTVTRFGGIWPKPIRPRGSSRVAYSTWGGRKAAPLSFHDLNFDVWTMVSRV
jgi:hypothetical protein